jgi:hypothetical protein
MKAGLTIQEMSKEILRQSQAKTDYLVNTANLRMEPWGNEPMLRVLDANGRDQVEPLTMKQTAHQQLGAYLDIPRKYYDRMLQQEPDLLAHNVNHWFQKQPEQRMIRTIARIQPVTIPEEILGVIGFIHMIPAGDTVAFT